MNNILKIALTAALSLGAMNLMAHPPQGECPHRTECNPEQMAEKMSEHMAKALELTDAQKEQVYQLHLERAKSREPRTEDEAVTREDLRRRFEQEQNGFREQMKNILSEEQFTKWEEMRDKPHGPKHCDEPRADKKKKKRGERQRGPRNHADRDNNTNS